MDALLSAMQERLREALAGVARPVDVFVTPDVEWLPHGTQFPAVGLKDHTIVRRELAADMVEATMQVQVACWVRLRSLEDCILGKGGDPGVLAFGKAVAAALDADSLELPGMQSGLVVGESGSEIAGDDKDVAVLKILTIEYIREVER